MSSPLSLTADISLYPQRDEYIPVIDDFIAHLHQHPGLEIATTATSTLICGEYDRVFSAVQKELRRSVESHGMQVLVCKFFVGERDVGTWIS
ncbi:MAG: YkoF family thiamine/hydroxymethylpyrimidine-binding protein [Pseudomonadota bacterium]